METLLIVFLVLLVFSFAWSWRLEILSLPPKLAPSGHQDFSRFVRPGNPIDKNLAAVLAQLPGS